RFKDVAPIRSTNICFKTIPVISRGNFPQMVGIFKGTAKPSSALTFFQSVIQDLCQVLQNGVEFRNKIFAVMLRCFVTDSPARAFSLGHRSHNSRAPCSRCWVRGRYIRSGVMVYEGIHHRPRTQAEYASKSDFNFAMYRLRTLGTRKSLSDCVPQHRARMRKLVERAFQETLSRSPLENFENSCSNAANDSPDDVSPDITDTCMSSDYDANEVRRVSFSSSSSFSSIESSDNTNIRDNDSDCDSVIHDVGLESVDDLEAALATVFAEQNMTHTQIKAILLVIKRHSCFSSIHIDPRTILNTPTTSAPTTLVAGGEYLHLGVEQGLESVDDLEAALATVFAEQNMTHTQIKAILLVIKCHSCFSSIHVDPRTILNTPKTSAPTTLVAGDEYLHLGVEQGLKKILSSTPSHLLENHYIEMDFSTDGASLDKLSRIVLWPIQIRVANFPNSFSQMVGIFKDLRQVLQNGVEFRNANFAVMLRCFVADAPARAFSLGHRSHNSRAPCSRCWVRGRYIRSGVVVYEGIHHRPLVNDRLEQVKRYCPQDLARKPIKIEKHGQFKATEQRQLLLYTAPVVFNGLVNRALYQHLLLLHASIRILANPNYLTREFIEFAEKYIELFVETASDIYGIEFLSFNTYTLLHLADDVKAFGTLDSFSAFPYESNMSYCRKLCRKPNQHLQQISNRRAENCRTASSRNIDPNALKFVGCHERGPAPPIRGSTNYRQYREVVTGVIHLSILQPDSTVYLKNASIGVIQNVIQYDGSYYLVLKTFANVENFFDRPCDSSLNGVFLCSSMSTETKVVSLDRVSDKCFRVPYWPVDAPVRECNSDSFIVVKIMSTHFDVE
ncbi:hypothetical protein TSAR_010304, partial [Trichomalopsis sarcophagae]